MSPMADFVHGYEVDENNASSPVTTPGHERARVVDVLEEKSTAVDVGVQTKHFRRGIGVINKTKTNCCSSCVGWLVVWIV